jgi:hypothetical protein
MWIPLRARIGGATYPTEEDFVDQIRTWMLPWPQTFKSSLTTEGIEWDEEGWGRSGDAITLAPEGDDWTKPRWSKAHFTGSSRD